MAVRFAISIAACATACSAIAARGPHHAGNCTRPLAAAIVDTVVAAGLATTATILAVESVRIQDGTNGPPLFPYDPGPYVPGPYDLGPYELGSVASGIAAFGYAASAGYGYSKYKACTRRE